MRRDVQATAAKHFICKKSFVDKQGREVLYREDWLARVVELDKRSNGKCERTTILGKPHAVGCSGFAEEPHHIIRRSQGRNDHISNLAGLSHWCHAAEDARKIRSDRKERHET